VSEADHFDERGDHAGYQKQMTNDVEFIYL